MDAPDSEAPKARTGRTMARDAGRRWPIAKMALGIAAVLGLATLWTWGPFRDLARPASIVEFTRPFAERWWALPAAVLGFSVAALLLTPMTLLMVVLVLLFGPWRAFMVAWLGAVLSAALGHTVGRYLWRESIGRRVRGRWGRVSEALTENEVRATIVLRLVPVAPFTLVNLLAGSVHIRLRNFLLGTLVGAVPFLALLAFASDRVLEAVQDPSGTSVGVAAGIVVALAALGVIAHRLAALEFDDDS